MAPVVAEQAQFAELPVAVGVVSVFGLVFSVSLFSWICCQRKNAKSAKTPPYRFVHMLKGVDIYPEGLSGKRKFGASEAKGDAHHAKATPSPTGTRPALHLDLNGNFSKPAHPAPKVRSSPTCTPPPPPRAGHPESALSTPAPTPAEKPQDREGGLGRLFFSLEYNLEKKAFVVHIQEAQGLCATDDQSLTSDPYIKLTILPEKKHKVKTRVLRKTLDPAFQETFSFYGIPFARLPQLALHFMVLSFDRFSRDEVIGETLVPLSGIDLSEGRVRMHRDIIKRNQKEHGQGELLLSLCYQSTTSTLTVVVLKARHLPKTESSGPSDPYVKLNLYQGAKRVCKKKTHVKKCSPNPVFNELFVFDVPWEEGLRQTSVELLLLDSPSPAASPAPVLGRLLLAASAPGTPGEHWREICDHPRRQIAKWHALSED